MPSQFLFLFCLLFASLALLSDENMELRVAHASYHRTIPATRPIHQASLQTTPSKHVINNLRCKEPRNSVDKFELQSIVSSVDMVSVH
ncbi:hypothetical protein IWX90DRAFT_444068 [Phyllosticta citrichinensis]|uniref:Uncharacterized protein n=1 Tax=Phyllosticta citrichinensis TaxID=1130410 RepID=A0ABR1XHB9_9PEZI